MLQDTKFAYCQCSIQTVEEIWIPIAIGTTNSGNCMPAVMKREEVPTIMEFLACVHLQPKPPSDENALFSFLFPVPGPALRPARRCTAAAVECDHELSVRIPAADRLP